MKLTVFGTSNSIMSRGWLNLCRDRFEAAGYALNNMSLGGSSSRYGAYLIHSSGPWADQDRVVMDFCINDQMFLDQKSLTLEDCLGHYAAVIRELSARGELHRLLVLLFPQDRFVAAEESGLLDGLAALLVACGVSFIDFRDRIRLWAKERDEPVEKAFTDQRHFSEAYQDLVGQEVLARLKRRDTVANRVARWKLRRSVRRLPSAGYCRLDIHAGPEIQRKTVGTSLIRREVLSFRHGETAGISGAGYLVGVLGWCHDDAGVIVLEGDKERIRVVLRRSMNKLFLFDSLSTPVPLHPGVRITAGNTKGIPAQKALGVINTIYDDADSTSEIAECVGCSIPPAEYVRLFTAGVARRDPYRFLVNATERLLGRIRRVNP